MSDTTKNDEPDYMLVLRPVRDPLEAWGTPARDGGYRLKLALKTLLRSYGLKCVRVCDVPEGMQSGKVRANTPGEDKSSGGEPTP
jgi:hypothetical protein